MNLTTCKDLQDLFQQQLEAEFERDGDPVSVLEANVASNPSRTEVIRRWYFDFVVSHFRSRLLGFFLSRVPDYLITAQTEEDFYQELVADLLEKWDKGTDSPIHRYPFLRKIAADRVVDFQRRFHARKRDGGRQAIPSRSSVLFIQELQPTSPSRKQHRIETANLLHRCLAELSEPNREALTLYYLEKQPYETIAEILQIAPTGARSRVSRARRALREVWTELGGDENPLTLND